MRHSSRCACYRVVISADDGCRHCSAERTEFPRFNRFDGIPRYIGKHLRPYGGIGCAPCKADRSEIALVMQKLFYMHHVAEYDAFEYRAYKMRLRVMTVDTDKTGF